MPPFFFRHISLSSNVPANLKIRVPRAVLSPLAPPLVRLSPEYWLARLLLLCEIFSAIFPFLFSFFCSFLTRASRERVNREDCFPLLLPFHYGHCAIYPANGSHLLPGDAGFSFFLLPSSLRPIPRRAVKLFLLHRFFPSLFSFQPPLKVGACPRFLFTSVSARCCPIEFPTSRSCYRCLSPSPETH